MNAITEIKAAVEPLELLRQPFPAHQISKLPKETGAQAKQRKADQDAGKWPAQCSVCGGYHHPRAVHLDYVGHAALTDRLLDADPAWSWEPVAFRDGLPAFDATGGLWIKLTVCGVTRLGYGHAAAKPNMDPGAREKEVIGDALRNAAMRFGAALDLWHKGALHLDADDGEPATGRPAKTAEAPVPVHERGLYVACKAAIDLAETRVDLDRWAADNTASLAKIKDDDAEVYEAVLTHWRARMKALRKADETKAATTQAPPADEFGMGGDDIPDFE